MVRHVSPLMALLLAAFVLLAAATARAEYGPGETGAPVPDVGITPKPNAALPLDATFRDQDGKTVRLGDYFAAGKPVILMLVYYECPSICGYTLQGVRDAIQNGPRGLVLGRDYQIVTISFNPEEKPDLAKAKRLAFLKTIGKPDLVGGWHFLTGEESQIRQVTDTVGFAYYKDPKTGQYIHSSAIFVCTPGGRVSQTIGGVHFAEPDVSLYDQIVNASQGRVGGGLLQTAIQCGLLRFNPVTGRLEHNPWMWAATIGGLVTILSVGAFLGYLWYGEFKKAPGPAGPTPAEPPGGPPPAAVH